eukprot:CAMPEP_0202467562 /NCGR_PEP_ID=MMETSP1360-20130828/72478_1 /ASSEMBLY_ACC=CAM_ASM_000848 /TAXON_ID=515479 /ORGANISM="Licmophora paradoxa, Strain CCMP2313" /LENGTH=49 /DNA_ID=CAMNT_0049092151 /DNA_START=65 /DNA_END=214 /DNA_ORIENTATION=-
MAYLQQFWQLGHILESAGPNGGGISRGYQHELFGVGPVGLGLEFEGVGR